jgi:hypothetical protein
MAKRIRPQSSKSEDNRSNNADTTAELESPKMKRSRTTAEQPVETANDSANTPAMPAGGPSEIEIRERAYHRYLQRGGGHGMDFEDWLEAERDLKKSHVSSFKSQD